MKTQRDIVQNVLEFIEDNLENDINLEKVSKHAGYSKFYLNRIFAGHTGITIYKYLQNRRLTTAAEKLVHTQKTIAEIAYESGYDSQQSFTLAFKQIYLCSPNIYRKNGIFNPKQNPISILYRKTCIRPQGMCYRGARESMRVQTRLGAMEGRAA